MNIKQLSEAFDEIIKEEEIGEEPERKELCAEIEYDFEGEHKIDAIWGVAVAYEGCHKLYVCENDKDVETLKNIGYQIHSMEELPELFENSCELRFIDNADLTRTLVPQGAENVLIQIHD